jgi:hypothetical protein
MSRLNKSYLQQLAEQKRANKPKLQKGDKLPIFVKGLKTSSQEKKLDPNWLKGFNEYMNYLTQQEVERQSKPEGAKPIKEVEIKAKKTFGNKFKDFINPKGGFLDQVRERMVESTGGENWYKTPNSVLNAFTGTITAPLSAPQLGTVYGLTGKVQTPSEAMNIQNPVGAFVTDVLLDPVNLIGAGAANIPQKIQQGIKSIPKTFNPLKSSFKSEIDWAKWNPETPKHKVLMDEYNAIEESTKKAGTWMKNPDGSAFQGTPEQFVQQNSQNFKKAFPNPVLDDAGNIQLNYHGSPNKFEVFDKNKFNRGEFGKGIYTTTNKDIVLKGYAKPRGVKSENTELGKDGHLYELYLNAKNPKKFETMDDFLEYTEYADVTDFGKTLDDYLTLPELKEKYKETLKNYSFKNDEELESFIANAFGRKNQLKSRAQLVMPDVDFIRFNDIDLKPQVTPFHASYPKSAIGNVGFFDMTNPNIYKGLIPAGLGLGAAQQYLQNKPKGTYQMGGMSIPGVNGSVVSSYQATQYKKYKSKKK